MRMAATLYSKAPARVKAKFADRYARLHEMGDWELFELYKELYKEVFPDHLLAKPDDPRRYERADEAEEAVAEDSEAVEDERFEAVGEVEEAVEDDEYVGQRVVKRLFPRRL